MSENKNEFFRKMYKELKRRANRKLNGERNDHTLTPTDLVHELFLHVQADSVKDFENTKHFVAFAEDKMRHQLVDYARKKAAIKRGGKLKRCPLDNPEEMFQDPLQILAINELIEQLENLPSRNSAQRARLAKLILFSGCSVAEAADIIGIKLESAKKEWLFARRKMQALWELDES